MPGFGVRVTDKGSRTFVVQYRITTGRQRRERVGDVKVLRLDEARTAARNKLAAVQLGGDPQGDAREARRQSLTMRGLFDAYLAAVESRQRPNTHKEARRALLTYAAPLHRERVVEVGQRDIVVLMDKVAARSGVTSANRLRAYLSAAWTWGLKAGEVEGHNPVTNTPKPAPERARERVLTEDELTLIWASTGSGSDFDRIVRLLILTAARREEVAALQWPELRGVGGGAVLWTLPRARSKNHREHEVPLTRLAQEQLPEHGERELVFGRKGPFSGWSKAKARLDAAMLATLAKRFQEANGRAPGAGEVSLTPWRLHDLRRTFATWANERGIEPHVVEAVLNHVSGARAGVAGVYNRASYREQKHAALAAWAEHIARITGQRVLATPTAANDDAPPNSRPVGSAASPAVP